VRHDAPAPSFSLGGGRSSQPPGQCNTGRIQHLNVEHCQSCGVAGVDQPPALTQHLCDGVGSPVAGELTLLVAVHADGAERGRKSRGSTGVRSALTGGDEVSTHVLSVSATARWFEHLDLAGAVLTESLLPKAGRTYRRIEPAHHVGRGSAPRPSAEIISNPTPRHPPGARPYQSCNHRTRTSGIRLCRFRALGAEDGPRRLACGGCLTETRESK
jgi:hypothetical protein